MNESVIKIVVVLLIFGVTFGTIAWSLSDYLISRRNLRKFAERRSEERQEYCTYMTKRCMASRFDDGNYSGVLRFPCGGRLVYLEEDADVTFRRLAAGKTDYDPTIDVDRYFVVCPVGGGELHKCPAWDAVRLALLFAKEKRVGYESRVIPEDVDEYGFDDASKMARVHKYDDLSSPFGYYVEPIGAAGVAEIIAAGEKCVHRRDNGRDCGDNGSKKA